MNQTMTKEAVAEMDVQEAPPASLPAIRQEKAPRKPPAAKAKQFPASIARSIIKITQEVGRIQKEGYNDFQRYKYTRWEDINEKLSPLLAEHGLIIVQSEQSRNLLEENDKGSVLAIVYHFTLVSADGEQWPEVEWTAISRLRDAKGVTDDKAASKCHTQAEKQFCIKQFKIRTDDFVDGDGHSTLPKKDAKDVYTKMQGEVDGAATSAALKQWAKQNAERIRVLPVDWQGILRDRYQEKLADLENQNASAPVVKSFDKEPEAGPVIWDEETGEVLESPQTGTPAADAAPSAPMDKPAEGVAAQMTLPDQARAEARKGEKAFVTWYNKTLQPAQKSAIASLSAELRDLMNEADDNAG